MTPMETFNGTTLRERIYKRETGSSTRDRSRRRSCHDAFEQRELRLESEGAFDGANEHWRH